MGKKKQLNCIDCENESVQELAVLSMQLDTANKLNELLLKCLEAKEKLCEFYQTQNDELTNKLRN